MRSRIVSLSIGLFLLATQVPQILALEFQDIPRNHPNRSAIDYLSDQGVLQGQGGVENFDPNGLLNRAEWAVILSRQAGEVPVLEEFNHCFPDVNYEWYAPAVCLAQQRGWVRGYQAGPETGLYIPTNSLNVAEVLVTLQRINSWPVQDQQGDSWYTSALAYAQEANIIDPSLSFDHAMTRAEAAETLFRTIAVQHFNVKRYDPILADLISSVTPVNPANPPNVSNASAPTITLRPFPDMPANATLAQGSLYVPVLRFTLEVDQPVTLDQLTIDRVSVGNTGDLAIGRLLINGKTVREDAFFAQKDLIQWRGLNQPISPGETLLLEMNIDFVKDAQRLQSFQFQVKPQSIIFKEAPVRYDGAAVIGQTITTTNIPATTVTIKNPSSKLSIPFTQTTGATIGKFTIKAGAHDVLLKRIKLEDYGNFDPTKFQNFRLEAGSQEISVIPMLDQFTLDFAINDYLLESGQELTFSVMADILDARVVDQVRLALTDPSDLYAFDVTYGFGTRVDDQFNPQTAWCLGSNSITCPSPGLRKHCSKDDVLQKVQDCVTSGSSSPGSSPTGSTSSTSTTPAPAIPAVPPKVQIPLIFGFTQPSDVLSPSAAVESFITEQAKHGITEVPIFMGGNVTPDGMNLKLGGVIPDLGPFMVMLTRIETSLGVPAKTLKVRPYIRASLTAADASTNPNGPGKISLNNAATRQNLKTLIQQIASGQKYGIASDRIQEITLDFEDITASKYDSHDLAAGDEGSVPQIAAFTQELKAGLGKSLGVFCSGLLNENWFPAETTQPVGSPFAVSPRNFISESDAETLYKSGVDVIEIGAYNIFPKQGGDGGFADPVKYGPIHANYRAFLTYQYQALARIAAKNTGLGLSADGSLRVDIPVFSGAGTVTIVEAVGAVQDMITTKVTTAVKAAAFDFGSLDSNEKTLIFGAENP